MSGYLAERDKTSGNKERDISCYNLHKQGIDPEVLPEGESNHHPIKILPHPLIWGINVTQKVDNPI